MPLHRSAEGLQKVLPDRGSFKTNNVHTEGKTRMRLLPRIRAAIVVNTVLSETIEPPRPPRHILVQYRCTVGVDHAK